MINSNFGNLHFCSLLGETISFYSYFSITSRNICFFRKQMTYPQFDQKVLLVEQPSAIILHDLSYFYFVFPLFLCGYLLYFGCFVVVMKSSTMYDVQTFDYLTAENIIRSNSSDFFSNEG